MTSSVEEKIKEKDKKIKELYIRLVDLDLQTKGLRLVQKLLDYTRKLRTLKLTY